MSERARYREIFASLRGEILDGKYSASRAFPSSVALAMRFRTTRATIRRALDQLRSEHLIASRKGAGTFVTKRGAMRQLGLIVPGVAYSEFFQPIVTALSGVCSKSGYGLFVGSAFSEEGETRARQALALARDFAAKRVSGVILQPIESLPNAPRVNMQILQTFRKAEVPVVLLDSDVVPLPDRSAYDVVGVNNFDAGRRLAVHLIAAGARRISFVTMAHPCYSIRNRFAGAQSVVASHGELMRSAVVLNPNSSSEVRRFLRAHKPDAILCCCDTFAAYLKGTLEKVGRKVPDDILLAGFDDVQHATIMSPQLTTAHQPCERIAELAFKTLMNRIEHPDEPACEILLNAPLVVRSSTRRNGNVKCRNDGKERK